MNDTKKLVEFLDIMFAFYDDRVTITDEDKHMLKEIKGTVREHGLLMDLQVENRTRPQKGEPGTKALLNETEDMPYATEFAKQTDAAMKGRKS